jgi:two-component system response regulator
MSDKYLLLVEDNTHDEMLTLRAFKKSQITKEIVVVRDGEEALEYIFCTDRYSSRDVHRQPQVILLDLKLPKLDGHQVLEQIRKNEATKLLPVIILTSSQEERDLHRSYAEGANSYVVKPVDSAEFLELIRHVGLYWLEFNKTAAPK